MLSNPHSSYHYWKERIERIAKKMEKQNKRPFGSWVLVILIFFQGLSGLLGGTGLILDPTGESLGLPLLWLENSPFKDYMIPGIILFSLLGLYPLMIFGGLMKRLSWAWSSSLVLGLALIIWIGVEIMIIGYHAQPPLQLIYGLAGLLILITALLPSVRSYYEAE